MAIYIHGESVSLSAGGSGSIKIRVTIAGDIIQWLVNSSGRAKITDMELEGYEDFFAGAIEIDHLKYRGNVYDIPDPIPVTPGSYFTVNLTDISGAANDVYFALVIRKR